jgi:hypothetical protein
MLNSSFEMTRLGEVMEEMSSFVRLITQVVGSSSLQSNLGACQLETVTSRVKSLS